MKITKILMGMHITVEVADKHARQEDIESVFDYFKYVDEKFSTYKKTSEISKINKGHLKKADYSEDMIAVLALCKKTKKETDGYFDILRNGKLDPSGVVKGWAILNASKILKKKGFENFYVDAGGDIEAHGNNSSNKAWTVGIQNPFSKDQIVKTLNIKDCGVATSGTSIRGQHIYNPLKEEELGEIVSITVVGPDVLEADRFATAAFAMQSKGIYFLEKMPGFEAYMIDKNGIATYTSGFEKFVNHTKKTSKRIPLNI